MDDDLQLFYSVIYRLLLITEAGYNTELNKETQFSFLSQKQTERPFPSKQQPLPSPNHPLTETGDAEHSQHCLGTSLPI